MLNLKVSTSLSRYPTESWGGRFGVWAWLASHLKILFAYWKTAQPLRTAISPPWFGRSESRTALSAGQGRAALGRQHWDLWLSIAGSPVPPTLFRVCLCSRYGMPVVSAAELGIKQDTCRLRVRVWNVARLRAGVWGRKRIWTSLHLGSTKEDVAYSIPRGFSCIKTLRNITRIPLGCRRTIYQAIIEYFPKVTLLCKGFSNKLNVLFHLEMRRRTSLGLI